MQHEFELTNTIEEDDVVRSEVVAVAEQGLGFGEGAISTAKQLERGSYVSAVL